MHKQTTQNIFTFPFAESHRESGPSPSRIDTKREREIDFFLLRRRPPREKSPFHGGEPRRGRDHLFRRRERIRERGAKRKKLTKNLSSIP